MEALLSPARGLRRRGYFRGEQRVKAPAAGVIASDSWVVIGTDGDRAFEHFMSPGPKLSSRSLGLEEGRCCVVS